MRQCFFFDIIVVTAVAPVPSDYTGVFITQPAGVSFRRHDTLVFFIVVHGCEGQLEMELGNNNCVLSDSFSQCGLPRGIVSECSASRPIRTLSVNVTANEDFARQNNLGENGNSELRVVFIHRQGRSLETKLTATMRYEHDFEADPCTLCRLCENVTPDSKTAGNNSTVTSSKNTDNADTDAIQQNGSIVHIHSSMWLVSLTLIVCRLLVPS